MSDNLNVIFGTGPVGMAVMRELHKRSKRVRMVNRSGKASLPAGVELVSADVTDATLAIEVAQGADVIYHALNVPYHRWYDVFPKLNAGAVAAAEANGAKLVVMDNLYMYGHHADPLTETTPQAPTTRKGQLRAELAAGLLEAHRAGRVQIVIGRAADFYGPGVEASVMGGERMIMPALQGKSVQMFGDLDKLHTYSYVPDVARGLATLADHDEAFGEVWHLPVDKTLTTRQFIERVYALAGQPPRIKTAPKLAIRAMGLFDPVMREVVEMVDEFAVDFVMSDTKFTQRFGVMATPLDEALHETVAHYRQQLAAI
jgi:nucleoside-diphosphate-sugar epimerase